MKITEVSIWKDRKIQIEQYEPYSFAYGMKAEVDENDNLEEVKNKLEAYVDRWLDWEVKKFKDPRAAVKQISRGEQPFNQTI